MTLKRNMSTPEGREFWRAVSAASRAVADWPSWKLAAGEVVAPEPRPPASEQTFTGQFEGNVPERLRCVDETVERLREAHRAELTVGRLAARGG